MSVDWQALYAQDPELIGSVYGELQRQVHGLEMIASENFADEEILAIGGTILTNKYAEGIAGRRYYGGCEFVDIAERLAQERACQLYGAAYANVQPHSGTQANMAAYFVLLKPGDTILAMDLAAGGHLTHGAPVNFSGQLYQIVPYGVHPETDLIDYEQLEELAMRHRPKLIVAGASAYPRYLDYARFGAIAKASGAALMADMAHISGLIAAGEHPSPVPYADVITSTTHKTLRGPRGGLILAKAQYKKQFDSGVCPRTQGGPLMHLIAAKAAAFRQALQPSFRTYQQQVKKNARALAQALQAGGLRLVAGGTDTHLVLCDLRSVSLTGNVAEAALESIGITANKNKIPFDKEGPFVTSGLRLGTPALTTRGMGEQQMAIIGAWIVERLRRPSDDSLGKRISQEIRQLTTSFPLYDELQAEMAPLARALAATTGHHA